ncbi:hypothetical protein F4818DRAFT_397537 [Hypoxylon cercidicola]|nr:hypothetical protein F4818DRAFT_397537 [Hypoxylon cercidicola]
MARERKKAPVPTRGVRAVTRRQKLDRALQQDNTWRALNPLKAAPQLKHKTYFELVENADKKKKQLEFKITTERHPPPGFEFVPIGHPKLTQACKDLSREHDAMIFIVSNSTNPENLDHHMNRVGYHFRGTIVDQARMALRNEGHSAHIAQAHHPGVPEPIPETQEEINEQADAVLKDLFPRIPNIDRKEIIQHAFQKDGKFHGEYKVGMASGLTLARRVQLAAIAFIRHTHTRYDELLKKTSWTNARKAVEKPCLDIIVKWRGDEETGRDQLDEILREVIEISDTEEESEDDSGEYLPPQHAGVMPAAAAPRDITELQDTRPANHPSPSQAHRRNQSVPGVLTSSRQKAIAKAEKKSARKTQRFRRYAAAAEALAGSSRQNGPSNDSNAVRTDSIHMDLTMSPGPARPVYPSREPTVVITRGTPIVEQAPRHIELRTDSQRFNDDPRRERIATVAHGLPESNAYAPPRPIHDPESHRPKVGHPLSSYGYEQVPVSSVRNGLQDMLLPSIEPASPAGAQALRDASHVLHREPRHFEEAPRIISREVYEPMGSAPRFRSPTDVIHGNESSTKRYRVADHTAGQLDAYAGSSVIPINYQGRGEDPRREPVRYFTDRPVSSLGGVNQHQSWPVTSNRVAHYHDETSIRSGANPVVTDDAFRRPHQVVEAQRRPDEDYQVPPFRREEMIGDVPVRRDPRVQDVHESPRIVYIREAPPRPRSSHDHFNVPVNHPSHGLTTYEEPNSHRISATRLRQQHMVIDAPLDHDNRGYREPSHSQRSGREPAVWPGSVSRDVRTTELGPPEIRYTSARNGFHERSNPLPISEPSLDRRQTYRHELVEPMDVEPQQMHYHEHQAYVTPSIRGNYIESYGPPLRHHVPEPQRIVWVDR